MENVIELLDSTSGLKREFSKAHAKNLLLMDQKIWKLASDSPYDFTNNEFIRKPTNKAEKGKAASSGSGAAPSKA